MSSYVESTPTEAELGDFIAAVSPSKVVAEEFDTLFAGFGTPTSQQLGSACRVLFDSPSGDLNFRALTPKAPEKSEEVLVPTAFRSPNSFRIKIDFHSPGQFKQQATQVNHLL